VENLIGLGGLERRFIEVSKEEAMPVVVIQESTAMMSADYKGSRPDIDYVTRDRSAMAVLHQTRNKGPVLSDRIESAQASAIRLTAKVNISAANIEDIQSRYKFHLLQLVWKPVDSALYAGKTAADGSITVDFVAPPLYPAATGFLLDADETDTPQFPFAETSDAAIRPLGTAMWQDQVCAAAAAPRAHRNGRRGAWPPSPWPPQKGLATLTRIDWSRSMTATKALYDLKALPHFKGSQVLSRPQRQRLPDGCAFLPLKYTKSRSERN
jgi:hypothetical protein